MLIFVYACMRACEGSSRLESFVRPRSSAPSIRTQFTQAAFIAYDYPAVIRPQNANYPLLVQSREYARYGFNRKAEVVRFSNRPKGIELTHVTHVPHTA
jgi:hypothetical protein